MLQKLQKHTTNISEFHSFFMHTSSPENLPVMSYRDEIIRLLKTEQVIIIAGDTGSGKTTRLPQFCLEAFSEKTPLIGCTQPRRVAATSIASRVSEELGPLGDIVGYKIRFHDQTTEKTRVKFMTDGVLLAETIHDPLLKRYGVIILDEAHERSLNIDFLLGLLKSILTKRPELKLIVTSATIDTSAFSKHFSDAPIVRIIGRTYPVELRYQPVPDDQFDEKDGYIEHCVKTIVDLYMTEPPGDILAFLPTERDIRTCCDLLAEQLSDAVVLPMFGRLQAAEQRRIFSQFKETKIVVATNVAETSITVPGIRYVVDSGLARISTYNVRSKTTSLPVTRISRASCDQRKGRCGRIGPGICVRLYSEEDYLNRDEFTLPEIQRSNLAEVVLRMITLNLGNPLTFPFIDSPHPGAVRDGYRQLTELGAIDDNGTLTRYGRIMASLPIDPCIARIIIEAGKNGSLREVRIIASAIAIQDPRIRPADREKQADEAHARFTHPQSDFLALLNIWKRFHEVQIQVNSWSRLKKFCKANFLSFQRMREWLDLHEQMGRILERHPEFTEQSSEASYQAIHMALTTGFLRNIATRKKDRIYQGAAGRELMIFPGSHQYLKSSQWIIAASFIETSRLYALTVAAIEPEWLESIGGSLCKYSWSHPRWEKKTGQVVADERVSLFGLTIVSGRKINFGRRDPANRQEARKIFIESALIPGELGGVYPFLQHNLSLIAGWQDTERRLRKRDILANDQTLFAFYHQRLGEDVYDRFTLNRFLKREKRQLIMDNADILLRTPHDNELANFPPHLSVGSLQLKLEYHFEPGSDEDGVTVRIPLALAPTLRPEVFEWLVPGLLQEKTVLLLKGLPKGIRKHLIPLTNTVDMVLDSIQCGQGSYYQALERCLFKLFKKSIPRSEWPQNLPVHLQMRFALIDDSGKIVATGRSLQDLVAKLESSTDLPQKNQAQAGDQALYASWQDRLVQGWDFDGLPSRIPLLTGQQEVVGFLYSCIHPLPEKGGAIIRFEKTPEAARRNTIAGMSCLYRLQFADQFKALKRFCTTTVSGPSSLWLTEGLGNTRQAVDQLLDFIIRELFQTGSGKIHSRENFLQIVARIRSDGLFQTGMEICETVMALLRRRREVRDQIRRFTELARKSRSFSETVNDEYHRLLEDILPTGFLEILSLEALSDCDRYLRGLAIRVERAHADPAKELKKRDMLAPHLRNHALLQSRAAHLSEECRDLRQEYSMLINEFRLSLFSPEIRTKVPVSEKKLARHWQTLSHLC
ncbi:MAG: ATP-dependent RNA helicase HrpA [Desulfocapsaceae bacterium]|nr:ATP-dependent RNA helicase HrpA [Desulfocapsaceae bacterium]